MIIKAERVPRVYFGRIVTPQQHDDCGKPGYILGLGKTPDRPRPAYLRAVGKEPSEDPSKSGDNVYQQLSQSIVALRKHDIPLEEGPYSDKDGLVAKLAKEAAKGAGDHLQQIDRLIDILRPVVNTQIEMQYPRVHISESHQFHLDDNFAVLPDEAPTAGSILANKDRRIYNPSTGAESIALASMMEPYLLAVSVLRRNGLSAYPALAVMPSEAGGEIFSPLLALVDLTKEVPLTTFALMRFHPPMGSADIISDRAMTGVTSTILAETRVKQLSLRMVQGEMEAKPLSEQEILIQLDRIADALFTCHQVWPGSHFISDALGFLNQNIAEAMVAIQLQEIEQNKEQIFKENPMAAVPGFLDQRVQAIAEKTGQQYSGFALSRLKLKIEVTSSSN